MISLSSVFVATHHCFTRILWIALLAAFVFPISIQSAPVHFPDGQLRGAVESALGKPPGEPISEEEMAGLIYLNARSMNIHDLTGLEAAVNLTSIDLSRNEIEDIGPLKVLTKLVSLNLFDNNLQQITGFPTMTGAMDIWLSYNMIEDISPLLSLSEVGHLDLAIHHNLLDISEGSGAMTVIESLESGGADVSYLPQNKAIINVPVQTIYVAGNPGDNLSEELVLRNRGELDLVYSLEVSDAWIRPESLDGTIVAEFGSFVAIPLELGPIPDYSDVLEGTITVVSNDLDNPAIELRVVVSPPAVIPDESLRTTVEDLLYKAPGEPVSIEEMGTLTYISIFEQDVSTLDGLQYAVNLERLLLTRNNLSSLTPISGLLSLRELRIVENQVEDISPLAGLTNLEELNLENNLISDLTPLTGLSGLNQVNLKYNNLSDISPLVGLGIDQIRILLISHNHLDIDVDSPTLEVIEGLSDAGTIVYFDPQVDPDLKLFISDQKFVGIPGETLQTNFSIGNEGQNDLTFNVETSAPWVHTSVDTADVPYNQVVGVNITIGPIPDYSDSLEVAVTIHSNDPRSPTVLIDYLLTPPVEVPDSFLRSAIESALGKYSGEPISIAEMEDVARLDISNSVADLTGLETAVNLEFLRLKTSESDISRIAELTNLTFLDLAGDNLVDISSIQQLGKVEELRIAAEQVSDLSPVASLTELKSLVLAVSSEADLGFLPGILSLELLALEMDELRDLPLLGSLSNLRTLTIAHAKLTGLESLVGLTNLKILYLGFNEIEDITALSSLTGLHVLRLEFNRISDLSSIAGLSELIDLDLQGNRISNLLPLSGLTHLQELNLEDNRIEEIAVLEDLAELKKVYLNGNYLDLMNDSPVHEFVETLRAAGIFVQYDSQLKPSLWMDTDSIALAGDHGGTTSKSITIRNYGDRDLEYSLEASHPWVGIPQDVCILQPGEEQILKLAFGPLPNTGDGLVGSITIESNDWNRPSVEIPFTVQMTFHVPDPVLLAALDAALGSDPGTAVSREQLANLTRLTVRASGELDLTGLEAAVNLESLSLNRSQISDLTPLEGLSKLRELSMLGCGLSNVTSLSSLTELTALELSNNEISDLLPLARMTKLRELNLSGNAIEDLSSLAALSNLRKLNLSDNQLEELSPLSGLSVLEHLILWDNQIVDITPLAAMTNLRRVYLRNNQVMDVSPLATLSSLEYIGLESNDVYDITPLAGLNQLRWVYLMRNLITLSDSSPSRIIIDQWLQSGIYVSCVPQKTTEPQEYETWVESVGLPINSRGMFHTAGSLGIENILAYAMGINPLTGLQEQLPVAKKNSQSGNLICNYFINTKAVGIEIGLESSLDLLNWTPVHPTRVHVLSDDGNGQQRVEAAVECEGNLFFRLKAWELPDIEN